MYKSGLEAMNPALDDIRPSPSNRFAASNVGPLERYISVFGGTALLIGGMRRGKLSMIMGGGVLLYRGATGFCPIYGALNGDSTHGTQIEESITVHKSVDEVYRMWRRIEDLPRFMSHLKSVTSANEHQSHWIANVPPPFGFEWDAEITDNQENRKISWRSLPGSSIHHAGSVLFHPVPARKSTEIKLIISCAPAGGSIGGAVAKLLAMLTEQQIREDLRAFKAVAESGEKPTIAGQPRGIGRTFAEGR
jgi:uncharacterized membrane protein